jgi:hypothetical protein
MCLFPTGKEMSTVSVGSLKEIECLEDLKVDGRIILIFLEKEDGTALTGFIWLRIRAKTGLLRMW